MGNKERDTDATMALMEKLVGGGSSARNDIFKTPTSKCQCWSKKIIRKGDKSYEELALDVVFNQDAHLNAFNIMKLSGSVADFKVLSLLIDQMTITDRNKTLPDPKFLPLAQSFCQSFVRLHPPCEYHTFKEYMQLLESHDRFVTLFQEMVFQVELASGDVMPDSHPRHKVRRTYSEEYSADCVEYVQKIQTIEEKLSKKYGELAPSDRLSYLFTTLLVFVELLEKDFEVWEKRLSSRSTDSKFYRPLVVHLVWKNVNRFDRDAITNKLCSKIFKFYTNCVHSNVSPTNLKVVARLINLISAVVELIGRHQQANEGEGLNLYADFRNFHYQPQVECSHGFALNEIENGRRKVQKPILYYLDESTAIGNVCKAFAKSFASALGRCSCKDAKECQVLEKAFIFIRPPWLLYLATTCLLNQDSDINQLKTTAREALNDDHDILSQKQILRSILFSSAVDTLQMLGYATSGPRRDIKRASKRIKLEPSALKSTDDVEEIISLIRSYKIKTY